MRERRRHTRRAVNLCAWIKCGLAMRACIVEEASATGACLLLNDPDPLPIRFRLVTTQTETTCEVIWRAEARVGVKYLSPKERS
jgi:PilZ domain